MTDGRGLSREEVIAIAELAKLQLTDDEVELYGEQLSACLAYFEKLQEVDTSDIPPTASVLPLKNILRKDEPKTALTPQEVIANAPEAMDDQFLVSAVLDGD